MATRWAAGTQESGAGRVNDSLGRGLPGDMKSHGKFRGKLGERAGRAVAGAGRGGQATIARSQSGTGTDLPAGKSTHTVVAPPSAYTTPGWSVRSSVMKVSKLVRPRLAT
jgi:hypothetical protein